MDDWENGRENTSSRSEQGTPSAASDVYMVRTPTGGIDGLDTAVGTGTSDPSSDSPGYADCAVWKIIVPETATDLPTMMPIDGLSLTVYNFSTTAIPANEWIKVSKDKSGRWIADTGSGGEVDEVGSKIVDHVHVVQDSSGTGTGTSFPPTWHCERVTLPSPGGWPPTADPSVTYTGVTESENRYPRLMDAPGSPSHIIPLFEDRNGNRYIVFWKTDQEVTWDETTNWSFSFNSTTCVITATPTITTRTLTLDVMPGGTEYSGLRLVLT